MLRSQIFYLLSSLALLVAVGGCGPASQGPGETAAVDGPLQCLEAYVDVGETYEQATTRSFSVRNVSLEAVRVTKLLGSCSCLKMDIADEVLTPGDETTITVTASANSPVPGAVVHFRESVSLFVDQQPSSCLTLRLAGRYVPPAYVLTHRLNIPATAGAPFEGDFDMFVNAKRGIDLTEISQATNFPFTAEIVAETELPGTEYTKKTIRVRGVVPTDTDLPLSANVMVKTTSKELAELSFQLVLQKAAGQEIALAPERLAFGILNKDSPPATRQILLKIPPECRTVLKEVTSSSPLLAVAFERPKGDSDPVVVTCTLNPSSIEAGSIDGEVVLLIEENQRDREIRVPVSGFIKSEKG